METTGKTSQVQPLPAFFGATKGKMTRATVNDGHGFSQHYTRSFKNHIALIGWNSPLDPLRPGDQACASSQNDAFGSLKQLMKAFYESWFYWPK